MKLKSNVMFFIKSAFIYLFLIVIIGFLSSIFIEPTAYNFMHKAFTSQKDASDDIVLIVIDDKSVGQIRWPWKRELYANMIEYLNKYSSPKAIGFDAIISSIDKDNIESDKKLFDTLSKTDNIVVGFSPLLKPFENKEQGEQYLKKFNLKFPVNFNNVNYGSITSNFNSITKFPDEYFKSIKYTGSVGINQDIDSTYKKQTLLFGINNYVYPSLSLRIKMMLNKTDNLTLNNNGVIINDELIPIIKDNEPNVETLIHFYKLKENSDYSHKTYSAIDILDSLTAIKQGKKPIINPKEFDNKIVFIGGNAKAAALGLEDALPTPMLRKHPGVDIQATCLDNIINKDYINQSSFLQNVLIITILAIFALLLILNLSFFKSIIALILISILYILISSVFYKNAIAIPVITPLIIQLATMIFGYSYRFILEGKNKEKIKQAMGKYISQDVMQKVVKEIDDIKLGGKKAVVTVLFADIRGFTSISENLSAEEVSMILNEYFTEIEPVIKKYNGVINKFIGDAVMAIFGEPIQDVNHPKNAVLCANEMLKVVDRLRDKWLFEGKPKIEIGIGINTGEVFVGNIGSTERMEYTVIGDVVNLASRIESYNKVYKTNFLISSSTYSYVKEIADVIKISEVSIRGKAKKMDIYEILRLS